MSKCFRYKMFIIIEFTSLLYKYKLTFKIKNNNNISLLNNVLHIVRACLECLDVRSNL